MSAKPKKPKTKWLGIALSRLTLITVCILTVVPILWVLASSFGTSPSLFAANLLPSRLTLKHYTDLFAKTDFLIWMRNTAWVAGWGSLLGLALTLSMAYAFSRFRFWGRRYGLLALILIQMLPATVTIVAIYQMLVWLKLINHFLGLILVYGGTTIPFNTWLMRGYFDSISPEMEESAYVDGANRWQAFTRIALPLCVPMAAVIFIFNLIAFYNDYLLASIVLSGKQNYTVALGLRFFTAPYAANWAMFAAASILAALPVTVVFYALQRYLVQGLTKGALKG